MYGGVMNAVQLGAVLMLLVDKALDGRNLPQVRRAFAEVAEQLRESAYFEGYAAGIRAMKDHGAEVRW